MAAFLCRKPSSYLHLLHSHFAFFEVEGSAEARGAHPANHDVAQELGLKILGRGSTLRFDGGVEATQVAETHTLAVEQGSRAWTQASLMTAEASAAVAVLECEILSQRVAKLI